MSYQILQGDCLQVLKTLESESVQTCVTSPPYYGLRDYGVEGQIGLESTPQAFVAKMVEVFEEVRRVLRPDGTLWLNLGDSYASHDPGGFRKGEFLNPGGRQSTKAGVDVARNRAGIYRPGGLKPKDLIGIPWRVAFALQEAGWWLRQDIIWAKPNPMPESVTDRCTKAHEYIFLLTKNAKYYYDNEAVKEEFADDRMGNPGGGGNYVKQVGLTGFRNDAATLGTGVWNADGLIAGRNKRSVWTVTTRPFKDAHFATFPPKLIEPCILAGTSEYGACADCGSPYERVTTVVGKQITEAMKVAGCDANGEYQGQATKDYVSGKAQNASDTKRRILESMSQVKETSWRKTCKCETDAVVPCLVIDPFNGAGTTGLVSLQHRRRYLGIELNPDYIAIAEKRLSEVQSELF